MSEDQRWFVYIVRCCGDGSLYTGITTDIQARVEKHNSGKGAKYTRSRRPVYLVWQREMGGSVAAAREEHRIKALSKAEKEKLISS